MKDDLTVEKLKINERLQGVEKEVALLTQAVNELKSSKNEVHVHLQSEMEIMHHTLYGQGDEEKPGLIILVDRLRRSDNLKNWVISGVAVVTMSLVVTRLWNVFFK